MNQDHLSLNSYSGKNLIKLVCYFCVYSKLFSFLFLSSKEKYSLFKFFSLVLKKSILCLNSFWILLVPEEDLLALSKIIGSSQLYISSPWSAEGTSPSYYSCKCPGFSPPFLIWLVGRSSSFLTVEWGLFTKIGQKGSSCKLSC